MNHTRTRVALEACDDYEPGKVRAAVDGCVQALGGWSAFIPRGARVLVKPNFIAARPADKAVVTHPVVIAAVCRAVIHAGGTPVVGDSTSLGSVRRIARAAGVLEALRPLGVEVIDLDRGVRCPCVHARELPPLKLDPRALDADVVINLPKFKTHCQCVMTLGVKNLFGCAPGRTKALWHMRAGRGTAYDVHRAGDEDSGPDRFARMLLETAAQVAPALTILDGIVCMEGRGPISGFPRPMGLLAASRDPVAIDAVGAAIVGLGPDSLPTLREARAMGLGAWDLSAIETAGAPLDRFTAADFLHAELMPVRFSPYHLLKGYARQTWAKLTGSAPTRSAVAQGS